MKQPVEPLGLRRMPKKSDKVAALEKCCSDWGGQDKPCPLERTLLTTCENWGADEQLCLPVSSSVPQRGPETPVGKDLPQSVDG